MDNKNTLIKTFWILMYFLSPVIPILIIYNSNIEKYGSTTYAYGPAMVAGTTGFIWLVYEFILSSRPKFIEKYFGMDKFYRFHGLMAVVSLLLVYLHKILIEGLYRHNDAKEYGDYAFNIFIAVSVLGVIFMVNSMLLKLKPIKFLRNFMSKHPLFKYRNQVLIHNMSFVAFIIMFIHVYLTSASKNDPVVKGVFIFFFVLGLSAYTYHKVISPYIMSKNTFEVKEVIKESPNMWTLKLYPNNSKVFSYKPGQFAFLKLYGEGLEVESHPFSLSSSPSNKDYISFTIKELGDYTSKIGLVKSGFTARVDAPYGKFTHVDYSGESSIVLIAGGVGISPALGILRFIHENEKDRRVILIWGVNNRSDLICSEEFETMKKDMKNFNLVPVLFKDDTWDGEKGIIDRNRIERIVKETGNDILSSGYYICGPAIMTDNTISALKQMGVSKKKIHFEKFSM